MTDEDRALLREIREQQKHIAESLREARDRLQLMSGGYLRQLERMLAIEATLTRLVGGHQSKQREPTVGDGAAEDLPVVTAADVERALEGQKEDTQ